MGTAGPRNVHVPVTSPFCILYLPDLSGLYKNVFFLVTFKRGFTFFCPCFLNCNPKVPAGDL